MNEQVVTALDGLVEEAGEPHAVKVDPQKWDQLRDLIKQVIIDLEGHGHTALAARTEHEYIVVKGHVTASLSNGVTRSFDAVALKDRVKELRSTMVALVRFTNTVQRAAADIAAPPGRVTPGLPERVERVWNDYLIAVQRGKWESAPTDQEAYDWCLIHRRVGDHSPMFPTWQRYLREARRRHGAQKNTPRG